MTSEREVQLLPDCGLAQTINTQTLSSAPLSLPVLPMVHTQPELTGQGARCNPQWPASQGEDREVGKTENVLEGRTEYPSA